ncbi:MAG: GNAT family N-acetyltransferase [Thermotogota bacterium]
MDKITDFKTIKTEIIIDKILLDYNKQRQFMPFLPLPGDFEQIIATNITTLQKEGSGWAFYQNNQLQGFLAGYKMNTLFGKANGIYIPLYGHCIFADDEVQNRKIYQKIYTYASAQWVKEGYLSHTITVYAKNRTDVDAWFWLGFGNRCVDSIKSCEDIKSLSKNIPIKKATEEDLESIAHLEETNHKYFRSAPLFMPLEDTPALESLKEWFSGENRHLWIAVENGKPVGFMRIQNEGESFISFHKNMMNITGAYILPEKRGANIATLLLNAVQHWLLQNNCPLLGVDFESFNIKGASFWNRHFTPYTFSLSRRIDERITTYPNDLQES